MINIYTDGGSRGNPGPSAIGIYIEDEEEKTSHEISEHIGYATNNIAEYKAVIRALEWVLGNKKIVEEKNEINFYLDSNLICSQINGLFRVKDYKLRDLLFKVREREAQIKNLITYSFVPRERNKKADKLVNKALDKFF